MFGCVSEESTQIIPDFDSVAEQNDSGEITDSDFGTGQIQVNETVINDSTPLNQSLDTLEPSDLPGDEETRVAVPENTSSIPQETQTESSVSGRVYIDPNDGRYFTKRCSVELSPNEIESGKTSSVKIYAYSTSNEQVKVLCGDSEKIHGTAGLMQDLDLCDFYGSGITNVWLSLDDHICASAPLRITTPSIQPVEFCQVIEYTNVDENDGSTRHFGAKMYLSNFKSNDSVAWTCQNKTFEMKVGELFFSDSKTGFVSVECNFESDPGYIMSMPVYVGATYCGDILAGGYPQ